MAAENEALRAELREAKAQAALSGAAMDVLREERDSLAEAYAKSAREARTAEAQLAALQVCLQREASAYRAARRQAAEEEAAARAEAAALNNAHMRALAAAHQEIEALRAALDAATSEDQPS
jgi:hypothetical protein